MSVLSLLLLDAILLGSPELLLLFGDIWLRQNLLRNVYLCVVYWFLRLGKDWLRSLIALINICTSLQKLRLLFLVVRLQLETSESMVLLVGGRIGCLQLFLAYGINHVTFFAKIEVKTVVTLIPHAHNWHHLTSMAFDVFSYLLPWLHYKFYSMSQVVVTSHVQFIEIR